MGCYRGAVLQKIRLGTRGCGYQTGLVNLLRTRAALAAKVVFRYRLQADKLLGITGLAPPSMSAFRANSPSDPPSQPGLFLLRSTLLFYHQPLPQSDRGNRGLEQSVVGNYYVGVGDY